MCSKKIGLDKRGGCAFYFVACKYDHSTLWPDGGGGGMSHRSGGIRRTENLTDGPIQRFFCGGVGGGGFDPVLSRSST